MPRILVLQLKRIGDAVLTAPALASLRAWFPEADITLVLSGVSGQLGPLFPNVDRVLVWRPGKLNLSLLRELRGLKAEVVLDFTGNDRSALLCLVSGAPVRAGYRKFATRWLRRKAWNRLSEARVRELHTIDFHHALLAAAGLEPPEAASSPADSNTNTAAGPVSTSASHLTKTPALTTAAPLALPETLVLPELPQSYILLHPGTAREEKFWPPASWAALIRTLHARHGIPLVLTGGDWVFETQQITQILAEIGGIPVLDLRGKINLAQFAGVVAGARLAITVDTAAMHLAAAFRVAQIALFGPTNPFHWAPSHPQAITLRAGQEANAPLQPRQSGRAMDGLPWTMVAEAAERLLRENGGTHEPAGQSLPA